MLVCGIIVVPPLLPLIVLTMLGFMFHEFLGISLGADFKLQRALAFCAGALLFATNYLVWGFGVDPRWVALSIVPLSAMLISLVFIKDKSTLPAAAWIFESLVYIALPLSLVPILVFKDGVYNGYPLLSFMCLLCTSDIGAYLVGSALGQRTNSKKIAPAISPKKSWIGFWGGLVLTVLVSIPLCRAGWLPVPIVHGLVMSALLSVAGVFGDLFESMFKRHFGVKDSGRAIPGHGGFLDRFDSWLFALPVAVFYLSIFNLL